MAGGVDAPHQRHAGWDLLQRAAHLPGEEAQWPAASLLWLHHIRCGFTAMVKTWSFTSRVMLFAELMSHCCFPEFASYQSLKFESISVEAFTFGMDQYVVFAQPFAGTCNFLEWDHVEMTFRTYDTIESEFKRAARSELFWYIVSFLAVANYCPPNDAP